VSSRVLRPASDRVVTSWPWLVPAVVAMFVYATRGAYLERAVAGLLALLVVFAASRRPDRSLLILIAVLPFQGLLLSQLYAWGVPAQIVRPMSGWKEALAIGVVVAGVQGFRAAGRRLDRLDLLALAYVAVVGAYALVPQLFAPDAPAAGNTRSLAFRASAGFVILLLAARHARLPQDFAARAARLVLVVGGVVAGIAVYEYFFSDAWNSFVVERVRYIHYQVEIIETVPFHYTDIRRYGHLGGTQVLRVGSVFLDPTPCGFFLVLPLAVGIERRLRSGPTRGSGALLLLIGAALLLTQTRSALIAGLAVAFLALGRAAGRLPRRRVQFAIVFVAALLVALPAAAATGLTERVTSAASGDDESAIDHVDSFWNGVDAIEAAPLGFGLGTSAGIGQRFASQYTTVTENAYLQVGVETGVVAMALFVALTLVTLARLQHASRARAEIGITAVRSAGVGLAVGAFFLHAWNEFAVAWPYWALAGACIGIAERAARAGITTAEPTGVVTA
jgi:hypothetical protein